MSSYVNMSLEDIIKNKKKNTRNNRSKPIDQKSPKTKQIVDARHKIISKNRTQITDAREKLAQLAKHKDARLKLEKLRLQRARQGSSRNLLENRGKFLQVAPKTDRVFLDASRQVVSKPYKLTENRQLRLGRQLVTDRDLNVEAQVHIGRQINIKRQINSGNNSNAWRKFNKGKQIQTDRQHNIGKFTNNKLINKTRFIDNRSVPKPKPIVRTVQNDLDIDDEPMDGTYVPTEFSSQVPFHHPANLRLKIVARNDDKYENRIATVYRSGALEKERSPPAPTSILKKRPMAALRNEPKVQKPDKIATEFRIIVSNLRNTVTASDIEELFGDVGGMQESRLVRPGTAEVIYKTQEDAQRAVDLYHNRQLDGQPMNCLLVAPRSSTAAARGSAKPALYSTNSNVEPDISTFHKVLFSNL